MDAMMSKRTAYTGLFLSLLLVAAVSVLGGLATAESVSGWYQTLQKPPLNPPDSVFGPVWTLLYIMMAVAAWRVWRKAGSIGAAKAALGMYGVQLGLNLLWSFAFFGWQQPLWGLVDIIALDITLLITLVLFWRQEKIAGILMVPYAVWVGFATYLNAGMVLLNG